MFGNRLLVFLSTITLASALITCSDDSPSSNDDQDQDAAFLDQNVGDISIDGLVPATDSDSQDTNDSEPGTDPGVDPTEGEYNQRFDECGEGFPPCEPPLVCFGTCQLPCSVGCPDDEECIEFEEFPGAGICGVRVGVGEECDFDRALFCEDGLYCDEEDGVCRREGVVGEGDPCGGDVICGDGLVCVYYSWGQGYCHRTCNDDPAVCGEGYVCISTMGTGNVCYEDCDLVSDPECSSDAYQCREDRRSGEDACFPRTGPPPGEQEYGEPCDDENTCVEDLICTPLIPGAYCSQTCNDGSPCPTEPPGAECLFGFCLFVCPGGQTDCPEDMTCEEFFGQALCHW